MLTVPTRPQTLERVQQIITHDARRMPGARWSWRIRFGHRGRVRRLPHRASDAGRRR